MWIYLFAYNLIRLIKAQSAALADILPRQISFRYSFQIWLAYRHKFGTVDSNGDLYTLCLLIVEHTVGHRPGRIEPRQVKRKSKPYKVLTWPRNEVKKTIETHGYPKEKK